MPDPISWLIIVLCLFGSFFFSATETSLACCNRFKIKIKADEGSRSAKLVLKCLDKFDHALTSTLIGNNIVAIACSAISTVVFTKIFTDYGLEAYASLASSIIMSVVVYLVGDTLPKTIAKAIPDTLSLIFVWPIYGMMYIFFPISLLFSYMVKLIEKIFKVKEQPTFTEQEFIHTIETLDKTTPEEVLTDEQNEILHSSLEFADTNVKEVLTPVEKMFALDINGLTHDKIKEVLLSTNYSRIPIYRGDINNIIGVLHVKTYLEEYLKNKKISIRSIITKPYFVSNHIMIDDLFNGFKKRHTHIAIVRDAKRKVVGMVTMEDVLEELVEDIAEPSTKAVK